MRLLITDHVNCEPQYRQIAHRNRVRFEAVPAVEPNMTHFEFTGDEQSVMLVVSDLGLDETDIADGTVTLKEN
jgi:hypothetical protein